MAGKDDCVTIWNNGQKSKHQKRLMLYNIFETFQHFKEEYPGVKIGLTKFTEVKPKNIKAPGSAGSHNVCICIHCENPKLMLNSIKHFDGILSSCSDYIEEICCDKNNEFCSLLECPLCLIKLSNCQVKIFEMLVSNGIDFIKYNQWQTVDKCELVTITQDLQDFVKKFVYQLEKLIPHKFIASKQSIYTSFLKSSLKQGQFLVQLDFAENISFKLQNESQSHYWCRNQATLHICVVYFVCDNGKVDKFSFIVLSDVLKHDSLFVYATIKELVLELKRRFTNVNEVIYISDGAPAHYKNKSTFSLIRYHYRYFQISAKWNFFATAHGKGPCDGLGGTVKRQVFHENLKKDARGQIKNAAEMFDFCSKKWAPSQITFKLLSADDISVAHKEIKPLFERAKPIVGSRSYHYFSPITIHSMEVKKYSTSHVSEIVKM